jgi:hypothetical protein
MEHIAQLFVPIVLISQLSEDLRQSIAMPTDFGIIHLRRVPRSNKIQVHRINHKGIPEEAAVPMSVVDKHRNVW